MSAEQTATQQYLTLVTSIAPLSFEAYVLANGKTYQTPVGPAPEEIQGPLGNCYQNAMMAAWASPETYTYVEGFAVPARIPLPMRHGWLVENETGNTVDPTWEDGTEYYGVEFTAREIVKSMATTGVYGIQDPTLIKTAS